MVRNEKTDRFFAGPSLLRSDQSFVLAIPVTLKSDEAQHNHISPKAAKRSRSC